MIGWPTWFCEQVHKLAWEIDVLEASGEIWSLNSSYWQMWARLRLRKDGSVAIAMVSMQVSYEPI